MKLLLDTHVLLWCLSEPDRIPPAVRRQIDDRRNQVAYSVASLFELATKRATGRPGSPRMATEDIHAAAQRAGYAILPITPEHALAVETIAVFHGDPVDRLLLAHARMEGLRLVTRDERLASYDSRAILF